jgi:hypothetical protein
MINFENKYTESRSGFTHTSKLYYNSELVATAKCHYLNRTWESYPFQSSMKKATQLAIESEIRKQQGIMGIKRLSQAKRKEIINYSSTIQQLITNYKAL